MPLAAPIRNTAGRLATLIRSSFLLLAGILLLSSQRMLHADQYISPDAYTASAAVLSQTRPEAGADSLMPRGELKIPRPDFLFSGPLSEAAETPASAFSSISEPRALYVSAEGSDSFPGSKEAPWKSFARALSVLQPGDTLIIQAGIYREPIELAVSGTSDAPITLKGMGTVVFEGSGLNSDTAAISTNGESFYRIENILIRNAPIGIHVSRGSQYIAIDGLNAQNCGTSLRIIDSFNISVKNSLSSGAAMGFTGEGRSRNLTFENVAAQAISQNSGLEKTAFNLSRGFIFESAASNVNLLRVTSSNHSGAGLDLRAANITGDRIISYRNGNNLESRSKHVSIRNSVFYDAKTMNPDTAAIGGNGIKAESGFLRLVNVTIANNEKIDLRVEEFAAVRLENSIIAREDAGKLLINENGVLSQDYVLWFSPEAEENQIVESATGLWADPEFKDGTANDYRLTPHSPALEFGNNVFSSGRKDAADGQRIYGDYVDAGAFELQPD